MQPVEISFEVQLAKSEVNAGTGRLFLMKVLRFLAPQIHDLPDSSLEILLSNPQSNSVVNHA